MSARPSLYEYPDLPDDLLHDTQDEELDQSDGEEITTKRRRVEPLTRSSNENPAAKNYDKNWLGFILILIFSFVVGAVGVYLLPFFHQKNTIITPKREWKSIATQLLPHLKQKSSTFPSQKEDTWYQIISGLKGLTNDPKEPAVYLLTYDEYSLHQSSCIAEIITTSANKFLLEKSGWNFLNGSLLTESQTNDPGVLIDKIVGAIEKNKIIIITDLQSIPAKLAQAFHFLVDEYQPKVRDAVYVLTLKIPLHSKNKKPVEAAEDVLRESWKELKNDFLQPLITRVTNQVLPIVAENREISCPLITSVTTEIHLS